MNRKVPVRVCREYDYNKIYNFISEIYDFCEGPDVSGKKVLVLTDSKCIRCFCCSEVCQYHAVEIRRKPFGT